MLLTDCYLTAKKVEDLLNLQILNMLRARDILTKFLLQVNWTFRRKGVRQVKFLMLVQRIFDQTRIEPLKLN